VPGQPEELELITNPSHTLTWRAPEDDGGSAIIGYDVEIYSGTSWEQINMTPIEDTYTSVLAESPELRVKVYAVNRAGRGPASKSTFPVAGVPGCPKAPIVDRKTEDEATLNIIPPTDDGGLETRRR